MTKKLLAFAAAFLVSLNASAGYVQYTFDGALSGAFIQNQEDKSIADYGFRVSTPTIFSSFQVNVPNGSTITGVSTRFNGAGPTNFSVVDRNSESNIYEIGFSFWESDVAGRYNYLASYSQRPDPYFPTIPGSTPLPRLSQTFFGFAYVGPSSITPQVYTSQDGTRVYSNQLPVIVPRLSQVPEPGTFALITLGMLGAASLRRRKTRN